MKKVFAIVASVFFTTALFAATIAQVSAADPPPKPPSGEKKATAEQRKAENARKRAERKASRSKSAVPDTFPAGVGIAGVNVDESRAIQQIGAEIRDALSLRKTLVVFLVETTPAAEALRRESIEPIVQQLQELEAAYPERLEMAALGYAADVRWATPKPVAKASELQPALVAMATEKSGSVKLCGAVRQAIDNFASRRASGSEVIFVLIGASSGDDLNEADAVLLALKRAAISVYGIGPPARFGATVAQTVRGKMERAPADENTPLESLQPERIRLALSGLQGTADLGDAGYGPFGMERICRQSGGTYLRLRDVAMLGWGIDPATGDISADLLRRYAPDYVNAEQYNRLLAENKCRMALHNAAQLPPVFGLENPKVEFPVLSDEARMSQEFTNAQRNAALHEQPIQQLYDAISAGESDRAKLTGARWQAGYDLAMGQILAAKARLDGYNAVLATLKQGKKLTNPDSKKWVLEPADEIAVGSALDKMAKNSRVYLKRVAQQHKDTPWATVAERELKHPAGWKLTEK